MTKPPLFFIHGMWSTPVVWTWLKERFEARGYQVHAPALPYHDAAPGADPEPALATTGVQDYVEALLAEARRLDRPPVIAGHSMGGMLAQKVAEAHGAAGLLLLAPAPTAQTHSLGLSPLRTTFGVTKRGGWWKSPTKIDPDRARWGIFNGVPVPETEEALSQLVWDSGRVLYQISMPFADRSKATRVDYNSLTMPASVVVGEQDRITPVAVARATARRLQGMVDYRELEGVGHWLFHDPVRETVAAEMDQLLARVEDN